LVAIAARASTDRAPHSLPLAGIGVLLVTHVDNHPLARDFPEYRQQIHQLKLANAHFVRLHEQYETLDREIIRAEEGLEHRSDLSLDALKMQRVRLKDELHQMLAQAAARR
jgi:uncharacterized protein YdcH (DUF465 family)